MIISGRNSVFEALNGQMTINKIQIDRAGRGFEKIIALAKQKKVRFEFVDRVVLDRQSSSHQGIVADVVDFKYCQVADILSHAQNKNKPPFVLVLDGIEDPHNFGAIIRSAECAGVDGIIIAKHRAVPVNETVLKTSAGAIANMNIARVTNINQAIAELQDAGVWVFACESDGQSIYQTNLTGAVALVIGSEGQGVSKLTLQKCDGVVSLPLFGKINSLNASVACGIALYEVVRQNINK
jgi:23S rRNA (guanosine2251-2'-O)-methyltransferase